MKILDFLSSKCKCTSTKKNESSESNVADYNSPILDTIDNHLKMNTSGALLLTGNWGSGKTYYLQKTIIPYVKSKKIIPLTISLYGETNKNKITERLLFTYLNTKSEKIGTIARKIKDITVAIPSIKNYIDIEKLIVGTEEYTFKLISKDKLFICFDDIERMSNEINIDDFLGIINNLIENNKCKVLLIGNESEIKGGITFKEKTIEKTIYFTPNINEIFDSIINEYSDRNKEINDYSDKNQEIKFKNYLEKEKNFFIQTLTSKTKDSELNKELEKSFSNIRTLKFALEHFKVAFKILLNKEQELKELLPRILENLWIFTLSISIEFRKPNNINFFDRKGLDSLNFVFSDLEEILLDAKTKQSKKDELPYPEEFKKKYYNPRSESYIFHEALYDFITSGKKIDIESFITNLKKSFNANNDNENPAHKTLNSFMNKDYLRYTKNEELIANLNKLLSDCEKGILEDVISYLKASTYLIRFIEFTKFHKNIIILKIKKGLSLFLSRVNSNDLLQSQLDMLEIQYTEEYLTLLIVHIKNEVKNNKEKKEAQDIQLLQKSFDLNLSDFVNNLLSNNERYKIFNKSLLHKLKTESVKEKIKLATPTEINDLSHLIISRYLNTNSDNLKEEIKFLDELYTGINEIDMSEITIQNNVIKHDLLPIIIRAQNKLKKQN